MSEPAFTLEAAIAAVRAWSANECVTRVIIFGSRSRDCYRPDSDLDIAVQIPDLVDGETGTTIFHFEGPHWRDTLTRLTGCEVDLQHLTDDAAAGPWAAGARAGIVAYEKP